MIPHSRQIVDSDRGCIGDDRCSRRSWLVGAALGLAGVQVRALGQASPKVRTDPAEAGEIAGVQAKATKAGLGPFAVSRSEHFLGLGDAPKAHREVALDLSEKLTKAFLTYFREHGFELALPPDRLTVVALKDDASYKAYNGGAADPSEGGHYDLETNRLVIFDIGAGDERANLFSLVHETSHQLSFNTGLLPRQGDVPLCISEGLATYVETWVPKDRTKLGAINRPRLGALWDAGNAEVQWIPIADLLADDDVFKPKTAQLAYAESWLLVHYLLKNRPRLPKFREYLKGIPALGDKTSRVKYAEARLGPLKTLDKELKKYAKQFR